MSSLEFLKDFVMKRLADTASEEIMGVFKETIGGYEEEIDRQRRLLDVAVKPEAKFRRAGLSY